LRALDFLKNIKLTIRLYIVSSFFKSEAENYEDNLYLRCKRRDRSQPFNEWLDFSIESMAIDELQSGNLHQKTYERVSGVRGNAWELFYAEERIGIEKYSKQDFYSALKKFDEKLDQRKNTTERLWSL
jgi:hypothetical protein